MLIKGVHADNFLSFAPAPNGFDIADLSPNLTVIVGPNGAGKSSIFRVVQAILDSLVMRIPGLRPVLPSPATLFHRTTGKTAPIRLALDVVFDRDDERQLIHTFWQNALLYPGYTSFQGFMTIQKGEGQQGNGVDPSRLLSYERWVLETVRSEDVTPLLQGTLALEIDPLAPYSTSLTFQCIGPDLTLVIGLNGGSVSAGALWCPTLGAPLGSTSLAVAAARSLPSDLALQLANFFDGQDVDFPRMPPVSFTRLADYYKSNPLWFDTGLDQNRAGSLPAIRIHLNQLLNRDSQTVDRVDLAHVLKHLIRKALICVDSFKVNLEDDLSEAITASNAELLSRGQLALYLFRLKNGPDDDRQLFKRISVTYSQWTHTSLDVEIKVTPKGVDLAGATRTDTPEKASVSLTTDNDIPLQFSGTGREQAAFLSALIHQHAGQVLLLDEPDAHLHPTLQQELTKAFSSSGRQGQYVVITHSPYMVPPGELELVRRIYMLPGAGRSVASRRFSADEVRSLNLRKRGREPDESMFLFSKATVFVEGPNDAAALPVWFDKWAQARKQPLGEGQRLGIRFQPVGGKAGIAPMMQVADAFGVPCIALYDADVLKKPKQPRAQQKAKNDNETVLKQWEEYQLIVPGTPIELGDEKAISLFPACSGGRIFLCGKTVEDDFEQISVFIKHKAEAMKAVGGGPLMFRYIARKYKYPQDYKRFFETLFTNATALVRP